MKIFKFWKFWEKKIFFKFWKTLDKFCDLCFQTKKRRVATAHATPKAWVAALTFIITYWLGFVNMFFYVFLFLKNCPCLFLAFQFLNPVENSLHALGSIHALKSLSVLSSLLFPPYNYSIAHQWRCVNTLFHFFCKIFTIFCNVINSNAVFLHEHFYFINN